jgi:hypothetical protein
VLRIDVDRSWSSTTIAGRRSSAKFCRPQFASSVGPVSARGPASDTLMPPMPSVELLPPLPPALVPAVPDPTPPVPACPPGFGAMTFALHDATTRTAAKRPNGFLTPRTRCMDHECRDGGREGSRRRKRASGLGPRPRENQI